MKVAVTDANIFIDLIKVNLLDKLFKLSFEIHTTAFVIHELLPKQKSLLELYIKSGNLFVYELSTEDVDALQGLNLSKGLSTVDQSLFLYAQTNTMYILLTNDKLLRKTSKKEGISTHGILWIFDQFLDQTLCSKEELIDSLTLLLTKFHRLPLEECKKRLTNWAK